MFTRRSVERWLTGDYDAGTDGQSQGTGDDRPVEANADGPEALAGGRDDGGRPPRVAHGAEPTRSRAHPVAARRGPRARPRPTRQTVAGFLRSWIASLRSAHHQRIRPRTLQHYEMTVERHIIPELGQLRLSQLTVSKVQAWVDADPASARSVNHHRAVLRRALNVAVRQRLLGYNPAALAETARRAHRDKSDPLTRRRDPALLEATRDDRLYPLWRLALATGLRLGELLGLAWDDVDLEHGRSRSPGSCSGYRPTRAATSNGWARTPTKAARTLERIAIGADTAGARGAPDPTGEGADARLALLRPRVRHRARRSLPPVRRADGVPPGVRGRRHPSPADPRPASHAPPDPEGRRRRRG
jgi:hypothetical protein